MNRFELEPFIMDVFNLDQRVTRRMIHANLWLHLLPDGFGSCERMIAIAHRKKKNRLIFVNAIFCREGFGIGKPAQRLNDLILKFLVYGITREMPTFQHEVKIE